MPFSRNPLTYPGVFFELVSRAQDTDLIIPCGSIEEAKRFKHKFNAFKSALIAVNDPLGREASNLQVREDGDKVLINKYSYLKSIEKLGVISGTESDMLDKYLSMKKEGEE